MYSLTIETIEHSTCSLLSFHTCQVAPATQVLTMILKKFKVYLDKNFDLSTQDDRQRRLKWWSVWSLATVASTRRNNDVWSLSIDWPGFLVSWTTLQRLSITKRTNQSWKLAGSGQNRLITQEPVVVDCLDGVTPGCQIRGAYCCSVCESFIIKKCTVNYSKTTKLVRQCAQSHSHCL